MNMTRKFLLSIFLSVTLLLTGCSADSGPESVTNHIGSNIADTVTNQEGEQPSASNSGDTQNPVAAPQSNVASISVESIPAFSGSAYITVNDNIPSFTQEEMTTTSFESYSELDSLGRCGIAYANIGQDLMPNEERGSIGQVKPAGWHTIRYDFIDGKYLYNRCHLVGFQLTGENSNEKNLITGTRYLNIEGMLPFENMVADYVKETGNHVLYRVTPIYSENELVARGLQMEGYSVEDNGAGISYNVFCYNAQPDITINYATGDSYLTSNAPGETVNNEEQQSQTQSYIVNTNTLKFHLPACSSVSDMKAKNKASFDGSREELINQGYEPCKQCNP